MCDAGLRNALQEISDLIPQEDVCTFINSIPKWLALANIGCENKFLGLLVNLYEIAQECRRIFGIQLFLKNTHMCSADVRNTLQEKWDSIAEEDICTLINSTLRRPVTPIQAYTRQYTLSGYICFFYFPIFFFFFYIITKLVQIEVIVLFWSDYASK